MERKDINKHISEIMFKLKPPATVFAFLNKLAFSVTGAFRGLPLLYIAKYSTRKGKKEI